MTRGLYIFSKATDYCNVDLPLVIEFFDEPNVADAAIHLLDTLVPGGHIVSWPARRYGTTALALKRS